jgi:drug/metabolite transporter superfamily protein YnfA
MSKLVQLTVMVLAAILEVGGDAIIRKGIRGSGLAFVGLGFLALGSYGIIVNILPIDFSKLLGGYVAVFALASVVFGRVVFHERIATTTWIGIAIIGVGSFVLHLDEDTPKRHGPAAFEDTATGPSSAANQGRGSAL